MADPTDRFLDTDINEIRRRLYADSGQFIMDTPVGESVYDRTQTSTGAAATTQQLRLCGFTARASQNITQVRVVTGATAAAATPSLCRIGVYSRNGANLYTLVASHANDTALFAAANTTYTKTFTAPFDKVAGVDYVVAILIVSAVAFPTFIAPPVAANTAFQTDAQLLQPVMSGVVAAQADLPATFAGATITNAPVYAHALLLQ